LQINFVGLSFASGESLLYQYRLDGADKDWSAATAQRTVNYANLAPGHYRFLVRALTSDGTLSTAPAILTFGVRPHVWQRWWFLALATMTVATIVYAFYRYRVQRLLQIVNIRTRIAMDLHDDIGANLTRISLLSEVAKQNLGDANGSEDSPLMSISRIARESVGSMSDIVWAIDPERDTLLDLTRKMRRHADEVFTLRDIELQFNASDGKDNLRLGVDVRRDLLLIFKEAVNNAARHSHCTQVTIDMQLQRPRLLLKVIDNGAGFDQSNESEGHGLRSMKRRAAALGGTLEIHSRVGFETIIRVSIPIGGVRT
jgi:signal transduction histidine kinase